MNQLKIAFVLDSNGNLLPAEYQSLIQNIRYCLYELRNSSFDDDCQYSLSFVKNGEPSEVSLYDLDTFSLGKQNQDSIFQGCDLQNLKGYDFVFYYSNTHFEPSKVMQFINNSQEKEAPEKTVTPEKTAEPKETVKPEKTPKPEKIKKSRKPVNPLKIIIPIIAACLILTLIPLISHSVKQEISTYKKVHTGDGDRLILRTEPDRSASELLRLNEGEVVRIITEGEVWSNVEYHDFLGYVKNEYLADATKEEYQIVNPDSMYNYGLACINTKNILLDGEAWIKKASDQNLLQAQWELKRINRDDDEKNLYWLKAVAENSNPYEYTLIDEWTQSRDMAEARGETDIAKNFDSKIKERNQWVKDIYYAAFTRLANEYLDSNPSLAGDYYLKSEEWSDYPDLDFIETLAEKFTGAEKIKWLEKAYSLGRTSVAWQLAAYYEQIGNDAKAIEYYKIDYKNSTYDSEYIAEEIYNLYKKTNQKEAFKWLQNGYNASPWYSAKRYYLAYLLGDAYEYGKGTEVDYYNAMSYYKIAKEVYEQAEDAYNRVYNYYYYWY